MLGALGQRIDATVLGRGARMLRHIALIAQERGLPRLARSMDWTAEKLWTAGGSGYWHSTDPRRKVIERWRPKRATINQALAHDLPTLVAQGRHLDRATPIYRGLVEGRKAELVGTGIGIEPNTGDRGLDKALKDIFAHQSRKIGALGESLWTLQRIASGEIDAGGSLVWRGLVLPDRAADMQIPFCILGIPAEWYCDNPVTSIAPNCSFVAGIEADPIGRGIAVHLRNPADPTSPGERVLLNSDAKHIFERRWCLQANGAPRLDTLVERVLQDDEIVNNEMKCARVAGALAVIVNDDVLRQAYLDGNLPDDFLNVDGGTVSIIGEQSKVSAFSHDRPSPNTREWRQTVKGDMAAGAGVSRVWTDRDGQAYNFANSKFDQIRSQMMVKPAHDWFGEAVASWPWEKSLPYLMALAGRPWPSDLAGQMRLRNHTLVPDVPPELDEQASAKAFETSNANGIDSRHDFLGRHGKDYEKIAKEIDQEATDDAVRAANRIAAAQKLCNELNKANPGLNLHWSHIVTLPGAKTAPGAYLQAAAPQPDPNGAPNASA